MHQDVPLWLAAIFVQKTPWKSLNRHHSYQNVGLNLLDDDKSPYGFKYGGCYSRTHQLTKKWAAFKGGLKGSENIWNIWAFVVGNFPQNIQPQVDENKATDLNEPSPLANIFRLKSATRSLCIAQETAWWILDGPYINAVTGRPGILRGHFSGTHSGRDQTWCKCCGSNCSKNFCSFKMHEVWVGVIFDDPCVVRIHGCCFNEVCRFFSNVSQKTTWGPKRMAKMRLKWWVFGGWLKKHDKNGVFLGGWVETWRPLRSSWSLPLGRLKYDIQRQHVWSFGNGKKFSCHVSTLETYCWWKKSCTSSLYQYLQGFINLRWWFQPSTVKLWCWKTSLLFELSILSSNSCFIAVHCIFSHSCFLRYSVFPPTHRKTHNFRYMYTLSPFAVVCWRKSLSSRILSANNEPWAAWQGSIPNFGPAAWDLDRLRTNPWRRVRRTNGMFTQPFPKNKSTIWIRWWKSSASWLGYSMTLGKMAQTVTSLEEAG